MTPTEQQRVLSLCLVLFVAAGAMLIAWTITDRLSLGRSLVIVLLFLTTYFLAARTKL